MRVEMQFKDSKGRNKIGLADIEPQTVMRILPTQEGTDSVLVFMDGECMTVSGSVAVVSKAWRRAQDAGGNAEVVLGAIWELLGEYMAEEEIDGEDE